MRYTFADYTIDARKLQLLRADIPLQIEPQVFALLKHLVENHERVVTRDELFDVVWSGRFVSDSALSGAIKTARATIGDDGARQALIRTVHGRGFHFVADVALHDPRAEPAAIPVNDDCAPVDLRGRPSLAVLPLKTSFATPEQTQFALGLAEEIGTGLARTGAFFVAEQWDGADLSSYRDLTDVLGVRYGLVGSLRFSGRQFRLHLALVDASTQQDVWAEKFTGTTDDPFAAQDQVTEAVLGVLQPNILMAEVRRVMQRQSTEEDAYAAVLRATPLCWSCVQEDNAEALRHLDTALSRDARYGLAHALKSWCLGQGVVYHWARDPNQAKEAALEHAYLAADLVHNDSLMLTILATAETAAGRIEPARQHIDRALQIDPSSAWAWSRKGYVLLFLGEADAAIRHFEKAMRLSPHDPMRHNFYFGMAAGNFGLRKFAEALVWIDQAFVENPRMTWAHRLRAACAAMQGDLIRARASAEIFKCYAPQMSAREMAEAIPIQDAAFRDLLLDAYRAAGFR